MYKLYWSYCIYRYNVSRMAALKKVKQLTFGDGDGDGDGDIDIDIDVDVDVNVGAQLSSAVSKRSDAAATMEVVLTSLDALLRENLISILSSPFSRRR